MNTVFATSNILSKNDQMMFQVLKELRLVRQELDELKRTVVASQMEEATDLIETSLEYKSSGSLEEKVTNLLRKIRIPANLKGYYFLREAIMINYNGCGQMMKSIYPNVSQKFNTTPSRAERAMRHAIEVAWSKRNETCIGSLISYRSGRPTVSEFVTGIADRIRLDDGSLENK
ncbi:sporulation initiation factor Spo0A C-terminal domain-containing protein [Anaerobacillus sp. MEB173]|uniref:sporulation initiation factor Spo0A C-terminal domain-containing protein n=1 Tax=Anaerobacillus sp. MEB173 TaxID=3383345 RepID=UPI003F91EAA2